MISNLPEGTEEVGPEGLSAAFDTAIEHGWRMKSDEDGTIHLFNGVFEAVVATDPSGKQMTEARLVRNVMDLNDLRSIFSDCDNSFG